MGTRSMTVIAENADTNSIVAMYRQYDGYLDGHGQELAEFLIGKRLVNGFGPGDDGSNAFNGMGCMAARVISHFKGDQIGGFYLENPRQPSSQEYNYRVWEEDGKIMMSVSSYDLDWKGTPEEFMERLNGPGFYKDEEDE